METIAGRIVIPHPPMIAVPLTRAEIADLAAYIMTLKVTGGNRAVNALPVKRENSGNPRS